MNVNANTHSSRLAARPAIDRTNLPAQPATAPPLGRLPLTCRHCAGSGREPAPLSFEFSRSGELRGEQQKIAEEVGISPSMLSMIAAGERTPGLLTLINLAKYFGTTIDRVLQIPAIQRRVHEAMKSASEDQAG